MVLSLDRWVGKVAIVTGASSGIGAAIAEQLVENGLKVAGLARRKERLEQLVDKLVGKKGKLYPVQTDISKEEDIINAFKWVKENLGPVHILVNNAGVGGLTNLTEGDTAIWENIFRVNVLGLSIATREAIKDMKANNVNGHIIHINSMLGHQVSYLPHLNVYPASKFAVTALAETLSISPGIVDTEMIPDWYKQGEPYKKLVAEEKILNSEDIADAAIYVLSTPPHVQIQELILGQLLKFPENSTE